jgi:two-component system, OmpR family, sensor histidine kinase AdeS
VRNTPYPLKIQIAGLAIFVAIAGSLAAAVLPDAVYGVRDVLFEASLPPEQRTELRQAEQSLGGCSPAVQKLRSDYGFDAWRLNYEWVMALMVALVTGVMAFAAWKLASRVSAPIESLAVASRRVAKGDRTPPPALGAAPAAEVGTLYTDFSVMTASLRAADEDLRLRSAAIAHDIRTPLAILAGRLTGLREGLFVPDNRFIDGLLGQVTWIDRLVTDINALTDARQAGSADKEPVDLGAVTQELVGSLQPELQEAGVVLNLDLQPGVIVQADEARIRRALLNVLKNLLRYARNAPASLTVRRRDATAEFVCHDNGPGFPPGDPSTLVGAFARGESSRSRVTGGSGLGLSIVQATAQAYGGDLELQRGENGGAVVVIRIPLSAS